MVRFARSYGSGGGFAGRTTFRFPSSESMLPSRPPSAGPAQVDRPFEQLGKSTINLFGTPGNYARTAPPDEITPQGFSPVQGEAFKGVPFLEQGAQIVGGLANIPGFVLSVPNRIAAARHWEETPGPERAQWQELIQRNAISQADAEARFLRQMWELDRPGPAGSGGLFEDFGAPSIDYSLGGQLAGTAGSVLTLPQRAWIRTTGGYAFQERPDIWGGNPVEQRLASFESATDEELNRGGPHPELIEIRDALKRGEISRDQAFDSLIVAGFGVTNPSGPLESLWAELTSDPVNLLSFGLAGLARSSLNATRQAARGLAREAGEATLRQFAQKLGREGISLSEDSLVTHALRDETMREIAERALAKENKLVRFMVLDAPAIRRVGMKIEGVLDPFTLFGRDEIGKTVQRKFSQRAANGAINGFGANNYRSIHSKARTFLGREMEEELADGFDRAAAQVAVQVGNEQNIRHIRVTNQLDVLGDDATAAAQASAERLGGDISVRMQDRIERVKVRYVPLARGPEGVKQMLETARARAINQVVSMGRGKVDREAAERFVAKLNESELSLLDFQHYGKVAGDFIAARSAAGVNASQAQVPIDRLTFVGPRQLTQAGLDELKKAVGKKQAAVVRGLIERYDDLYRIYDLELGDEALLAVLKDTLDQLSAHTPQTIDDITKLPVEVQEWLAKYQSMGYGIALRPADDVLARPILDSRGRIVGVNPWVDYVDAKTARQSVGRLSVLQRALFNNISGAAVVRDSKQRFIRLGAERFGLPEAAAEGLFSSIMRAASDQETTARGLTTHQLYRAAIDARMPKSIKKRMTEREFAELVMESWEGSFSKVGVTQKFTGKVKSAALRGTGSNIVGVIAERIYGMARFRFNPFFQLQEIIETPFFLLLRGRIPIEDFRRVWTGAGRRAIGEEVDRTLWVMSLVERKGSFYNIDMQEFSDLVLVGNRAINHELQRKGLIARIGRAFPSVRRMKDWGLARSFQYEQARTLSQAFRDASPQSWDNFATWMAYRSGQRNDLEAVTNFAYDAVARSDPDSVYSRFGPSAFKPHHLGAEARLSTKLIRSLVLGEEAADEVRWKSFHKDVRSGKVKVSDIEDALRKVGADPVYIERAVNYATFPPPDEFYRAFVALGRPQEEIDSLRAWQKNVAQLRGMDEQEWLSRQFADSPAGISHMGNAQTTYFQMIADSFERRGLRVPTPDDPNIAALAEQGEKYLARFEPAAEGTPVGQMTDAQKKARGWQGARSKREVDPDAGTPPELDDASRARIMRYDAQVHRIGRVSGDEWWDQIEAVMPDAQLREAADWYIDMRRGFLALAEENPDEAARLLVLFGVSQINTSPVDGMRFVHRALAAHRRGEELPIDPKFSGLNSGAIKQLLEEGSLTSAGMGQKLVDFIDSLLGRSRRTAGVDGPDPLRPWQPAAADIWAKRDVGFLDDKMARHLGNLYGGTAVWEDGVGFRVTPRGGEEFVIPKEKVTANAPSDVEYDYIIEFYNERAREANQRRFLDRDNWTAAEIQALGWFRTKLAMGDYTGSPLDAFHGNRQSVYWEAVPAPGTLYSDILPGIPREATATFDETVAEGVPSAREVAARFIQADQRALPPRRRYTVDPDFGLRTARAYAALPSPRTPVASTGPVTEESLAAVGRDLKVNDEIDAATRESYQVFVDETLQQAEAIRASGVRFVPVTADPYENSAAMMADVRDNGQLKVFASSAEHPLLTDDQNVLFRAVHDYFAHAAEGNQFGPRGELNAAVKHSQMYSPTARRAMLTETHGQNSFVNFSDEVQGGRTVAEINREKPGTIYAEQKAALLPDDILNEFTERYTRFEGLPENVARAITADVAPYVQMEAQRLLGVSVIARYDSIGAWQGGMNPNAAFEVLGTHKDASAFARTVAYLSQQNAVPVDRLTARNVSPAEGRFHAVDWQPAAEATYEQAERALRQLADHPLIQEGGSVVRYDDGSYGIRSIWMNFDQKWWEKGSGTLPVSEFKRVVPDESLTPVVIDDVEFTPLRTKVESSYHDNDWFAQPGGEGHLDWLRENGYGKVADELAGTTRHRASLFYERTFRKHYARGTAEWRQERALDAGWSDRAGPLLEDLDATYGRSVALDAERGTDLVARAAAAAERGDTFFQRAPRGTLGAVALDAADRRARVFLNARSSRTDTLLHELSHQFAEQGLDESGRRAILNAYNDDVGRGVVRPTQRGGPAPVTTTTWTEDVHEWFANQMVEWVRTGEAPARHLEPIFGFYSQYIKAVGRRQKLSPEVKTILDEVTARPVRRAHGFNVDEEGLFAHMLAEGDRAARNSRDLIYFRTNRSWLERSLNHPYFGMYPLSYMWGKVLPEMIQFLAFRPFGLKAPAVGFNTTADIYRGLMMQQENDQELREYLADNEPALRAIAMLVPGVPWDMPVNTPLWMRRIAEAIATQNQRVMEGKRNPDGTPASIDLSKIDIGRIISDVSGYALNPVRGFETIGDTVTGIRQAGELGLNLTVGGGVPSSEPDVRTMQPPALTTESSTSRPQTQPLPQRPPLPQVAPPPPEPEFDLSSQLEEAQAQLFEELNFEELTEEQNPFPE